jgi:osmotically-inducible protein OsmY
MTAMNQSMSPRQLLLIAAACGAAALVQGCAPAVVVGAGAGAAVVHDRRSLGSMVDDAAVELKAKGMLSTDPLLKDQANIKLTSVNGIVLLSGETATAELRDHVLATVREIRGIRRITNEIRIAPPSSLGARAKDTWITGEVKARFVGARGLDPTRVKVVTEAANVYLMGLVTQREGEIATDAATQVRGVERVVKLFEYLD